MLKTKFGYVAFVVIFACSCQKKDVRQPLTYDVKKVQDVMIDLYIAEQALTKLEESNKDSLRDVYTDQIESIHEVDISLLEKDIDAIKMNPKWYVEVHKSVKDSITTLESRSRRKRPKTDSEARIDAEIKKAAKERKTKSKR